MIHPKEQDRHRITFDALGTDNVITAWGEGAEDGLVEARRRVLEIHDEMNAFSTTSDVARVSQAAGGGATSVSQDTMRVLACAKRISEASGGAFDPTVRPVSALWHLSGPDVRIPDAAEVESVLGLVGWRDIELDAPSLTARLTRPGQAIDLGGIAKGYAADEARSALSRHGVESAIIDLGGNIVTMGSRPDGTPWRIGIQNPLSPRGELAMHVSACDAAIVTSGVNERFTIRSGTLYHHVIDPRTGYPSQSGIASATVVAATSLVADALATAVLVLGAEKGAALAKGEGAEVVVITTEGEIFASFDPKNMLNLKTT